MGRQVLAGQEEAFSKVCKLCNAELGYKRERTNKKFHILFKWHALGIIFSLVLSFA